MKKIIFTLIAISMVSMSTMSVAAMSLNKVRNETRFLTDKMAYELNLSTEQYNDCYEINYDFIYNVRDIMDEVVYGEDWALDRYYNFLDVRNDDLRWILADWQYERFLDTEYFYRPIYSEGSSWGFRIYLTYTNPYLFYFGKPYHYRSYSGGHYRTYFNNNSYYVNRYHHNVYRGSFSTRRENVYINNRRSDFGDRTPRNNSSVDRNRRSSSRIFNDELYNNDRSSGSPRSRVPGNVTRPTDNKDSKDRERSSSDRDNNSSGRDVNKSRETNTDRSRSTERGTNPVRTPRNESYYNNSDSRSTGNGNYSSGSNGRSSSSNNNSSTYSPERSNSSSRSSDYTRSSAVSRPSSTSGNTERSSSYSRPSSGAESRGSSSVSRSSDNNRGNAETRSSVSTERSSSSSNSSSRSSDNNNNNNSRSSDSSRGSGRTR